MPDKSGRRVSKGSGLLNTGPYANWNPEKDTYLRRLEEQRRAREEGPDPFPWALAAPEMALTMGTGLLSMIPAGHAGAMLPDEGEVQLGIRMPNGKWYPSLVGNERPTRADMVEHVMEKLTYVPRTEVGQEGMQRLGEAMTPLMEDFTKMADWGIEQGTKAGLPAALIGAGMAGLLSTAETVPVGRGPAAARNAARSARAPGIPASRVYDDPLARLVGRYDPTTGARASVLADRRGTGDPLMSLVETMNQPGPTRAKAAALASRGPEQRQRGGPGYEPPKMTNGVNDLYYTSSIFGEKRRLEVLKNPTDRQLAKWGKDNGDPYVRFAHDSNGDLYVWNGEDALHNEAMELIDPGWESKMPLDQLTRYTSEQPLASELRNNTMFKESVARNSGELPQPTGTRNAAPGYYKPKEDWTVDDWAEAGRWDGKVQTAGDTLTQAPPVSKAAERAYWEGVLDGADELGAPSTAAAARRALHEMDQPIEGEVVPGGLLASDRITPAGRASMDVGAPMTAKPGDRIRTEDGYQFDVKSDGTVTDGDMSWPSVQQFVDDMKNSPEGAIGWEVMPKADVVPLQSDPFSGPGRKQRGAIRSTGAEGNILRNLMTREGILNIARTGRETPLSTGVAVREGLFDISGPGSGEHGRVTKMDAARTLEYLHRNTLGRKVADPTTRRGMNNMIARGADDVGFQLEQPVTGQGWYDEDIAKTFGLLRTHFNPRYADPDIQTLWTGVAAPTSYGTPVPSNAAAATKIMDNYFDTGRIPLTNPETGKLWTMRASSEQGLGITQHLLDRFGLEGYVDFMTNPQTLRDMAQLRMESGMYAPGRRLPAYRPGGVSGKLEDTMPGAYILGPKGGPFFLNLNDIDDTTVDLWQMRNYGRNQGQIRHPVSGEIIDAPISDAMRSYAKEYTRGVADRFGLSEQDTQAIQWYFEQQLYDQLGVSGAVPQAFSEGVETLMQKRGILQQ